MAKSDKKAVKSAKPKAPATEKKLAAPAKAKAISSTDILAKSKVRPRPSNYIQATIHAGFAN